MEFQLKLQLKFGDIGKKYLIKSGLTNDLKPNVTVNVDILAKQIQIE